MSSALNRDDSLTLVQIRLYVEDLGRSSAFYEGLGFSLIDGAGHGMRYELGTATIELFEARGEHEDAYIPIAMGSPRGQGAIYVVRVLDIDEVRERAALSGLEVGAIDQRGWGVREMVIHDPDGYWWAIGSVT